MFVAMLAAFVIAALSGMGVGGGGLFVIYLTLVTDMPQLAAQGLNLLFFLFSSGAALPVHLLRRRLRFGVILLMASSGIVGALLGTLVSGHVEGAVLRKIFGVMLVISGIYSLKRKAGEREVAEKFSTD